MFGYEDKRTEKERLRDLEAADKRKAECALAIGFLKAVVRPLLAQQGAEVGLVGQSYGNGELLVAVDGVTYKLTAQVNNDD